MIPDSYYYLHVGRAANLAKPSDRWIYRIFEIFPGLIAWTTLAALVSLSVVRPVWIALFIIVFDLYWFFRTLYLMIFLHATYNKMKRNMRTDWMTKIKNLSPVRFTAPVSSWEDLFHVVFLPMYKEEIEILESTFESFSRIDYPKEKLIVVLATEEGAGFDAQERAQEIEKKYGALFGKFFITKHPNNIAGELAGKGSNLAWAARTVKEYFDSQSIRYERVIVSAFDIDTKVLPGYFSCLTYAYLTSPNPTRASYQPIPFYNNNIWQAPALARVLSYSSTFWHMMQQDRPDLETTFSSHSMGFKALADVGFWQRNMVSEDSRIFFQCLLRYDGDYRVVSLYYPVSMDANVAPTFWRTMMNQYKQQRRWAWGAENIPYFLFGAWKNARLKLAQKIRFAFLLIEGSWSWATNSIAIFLLGWLPILVGGQAFRNTILSFNLPRLTGLVMTAAMFGIITSATLCVLLMPPLPQGRGKLSKIWIVAQWIFAPVVFIVFGSLPALDAETRLMLGKYMGFWVTEKARKKIIYFERGRPACRQTGKTVVSQTKKY
jgi:cellulose synthase/poly-beta-1,6-N-acetylglucosamine synthase-like glycosyltransferase